MKLKKKSGLIGAVVALSAASLVSVGFASWVISAGAEASVTGQITVDTVSDNRLSVTAAITQGNPIIFGGLGVDAENALKAEGKALYNKPIWLTNDHTNIENLSFTVRLTFAVGASGTLDTNLSAYNITYALTSGTGTGDSFEENEVATVGYLKAQSENYVTSLASIAAAPDYNGATTLNTNYVDVKFNFGWGSVFGGKNPFEYYNAQTYSQTVGDDANTKLDNLHTWLTNVTFKLDISVKYAA